MTPPDRAARDASPRDASVRDVVAIGETMVAFTGYDDRREYQAVPAGAESNVAGGVAALGHTARWVSRLGDDHLGRLLVDEIGGRGVDVDVVWDGTQPTGIMTKHVVAGVTERRYYRSQSAARSLSPADLARLGPARWVHVTGITPALSASAADLVRSVVDRRDGHSGLVSFDVNLRPVLWPDVGTAASTLSAIARSADLIFIGDDEARALFGTDDIVRLGDLLLGGAGRQLVLKRGGGPASVTTGEHVVTVPALATPVVDPTGAGDAFAAGYLVGRCRGWAATACLRLGHLMASRVLGVLDDVTPPFRTGELTELSPDALARRWRTGH